MAEDDFDEEIALINAAQRLLDDGLWTSHPNPNLFRRGQFELRAYGLTFAGPEARDDYLEDKGRVVSDCWSINQEAIVCVGSMITEVDKELDHVIAEIAEIEAALKQGRRYSSLTIISRCKIFWEKMRASLQSRGFVGCRSSATSATTTHRLLIRTPYHSKMSVFLSSMCSHIRP